MIEQPVGSILIVDDTPANLRLLNELLVANGFKVRPATSGELAIKSAQLTPPDLILLDIRMPGMDGYEVCRRLKAEPVTQAVPVIFISALGELQDRIRGFELGAVDYITKPFEREEVLLRVRTHLELHRMRVSLESMVAERTRQLSETVRALKTLSGVNHALVHAVDEAELLAQVGRVVQESGGFPVLWIGMCTPAGDDIEVVAQRGVEPELVAQLAETAEYNPAREAILHTTAVRCDDIASSAQFGAATPALVAQGLCTAITLPLAHAGETLGVISLFSDQPEPIETEALALLHELADDLAFGIQHLRSEKARRLSEQQRLIQAEQLGRALGQTIQAVALTVEKRDPYTAGHQTRVAELALAVGAEMGLDALELEGLRMSATIHDLGKIYIPAEILNRPGKLSEVEFQIIQTHPQVGHDIIQGVEFPWPVAEIILQHHERLDGSGYPRGLKGEQILPLARIIAVADVVDAMSSHRPYRPAVGVEAALEELSLGSGSRYDAQAVAACLVLFRERGYQLSDGTPEGAFKSVTG